MKNKNRLIIAIILIISVLLLTGAGTFAYWYWSGSNSLKNLVISTGGIKQEDIVYKEGNSSFVGNFQPTDTFCQSVNTTISFYKKSRIKNYEVRATIKMDISEIGTNISESNDVYWVVTSGENEITCSEGLSSDSVLGYGTFYGNQSGEVITLLENILINTYEEYYTIWVWIDSSSSSLSSLTGNNLSTNVWTEITTDYEYQPNEPEVDPNMIPVIISDDGTVTIVSKNDPDWFNYSEKKWANVVLVREEPNEGLEESFHSRSYYKNNIGETVSRDDILAYYVWIPRYKYKIDTNYDCVALGNPTIEDNPECFSPYTVSDETKEVLINYYLTESNGIYEDWDDDDYNQGTHFVERALDNGIFDYNFTSDIKDDDKLSIPDIIDFVNRQLIDNDTFIPGKHGYEITKKLDYEYVQWKKEKSIDILFESKDDSYKNGDAINSYYTHPAFWWDDDNDNYIDSNEMLAGIWVGKFETSFDEESDCYLIDNVNNCNNSYQNPRVQPFTSSLRWQNIGNQFYTSQNFSKSGNVYGLDNTTINAHMMKNSEWGAVAYLSHSKYGIDDEIILNNQNNYYSGCGALEDYTTSTIHCRNSFGSVEVYPQSTTGNISGIFDMSGGTLENVMAHYGVISESQKEKYNFVNIPEKKYYDVYSEIHFSGSSTFNLSNCTLGTCGGHALSETAGWYGDSSGFVTADNPWIIRGGSYEYGKSAGIFHFSSLPVDEIYSSGILTWRSVLVPGFGL